MDNEETRIGEALQDIVMILSNISQRLETIENQLSRITLLEEDVISETQQSKAYGNQLPSSMDILELQESRPGVFRTFKAIQQDNKWYSAQDIADITNRSRGLESRYLNELAELGIIDKKRAKISEDSRITEVLFKVKEVSA